jgi:transposase InsO family protein
VHIVRADCARARPRPSADQDVIERFYGLIKYEHLYLHEIDDGPALAEQVAGYQQIYNQQRPHEAIKWSRPAARRTANPDLIKCRPPHTGPTRSARLL